MHDMRAIAERIVATRARRDELSDMRPQDEAQRLELTALEGDVSRFDAMCLRHRRINLCRDGFVYGDILRHPADSDVAVVVRIGDLVEFVKGQETPDGDLAIMEATRLVAQRARRGASVRDWYRDGDGASLARMEDAARAAEPGLSPMPRRTETPPAATIAQPETVDAPASEPETEPKASRSKTTKADDRTMDLFG